MNNQLVSSSSFSSPPLWKYDVFLSFRGEDTRTNFTDHFYKALDGKAITTFIDHQLKRGEEISQALLKAIDESRISIIIFSKNYASSRWCLEELIRILECRKSRQQIVLPVFYKVDPSHVRKQTSSFGDAFTEKFKFEDSKEKILTWRSALTDAASLSGYTFKEGEYEATFISQIVNEILVRVLQGPHLNVAKYQVGMESCVEKVKELLDGGNDPCVVGIWGASGIGKTEVAKTVYNAIAYKFEGRCFLADVREKSMQYEGLLQLQNTLLSEIGGSEWKAVNTHRGNILIEKLLRRKKILLILDDVDELEQLNNLVQVEWLGEGSTMIITTKDIGLLKSYDVELIYEVQKLKDDKALELLSWNAFRKKEPSDDYLGLARRAIAYAQGHPLALNLIGSYLRNKSIDCWQALLDSYDSYDREPYGGIQKILRKSYDTLDYVMQQVFLDIACFFKGENKDYVLRILRSSKLSVPQDCIEVLVEKAIITIEYNRILMHDLIEKMGKRIVCDESPTEAGERSRLWHHEDVYRVLTENRGTKEIKGIVVKLPKPDVIPLNAKSFFKMVNLEIFISCNALFSGCVEYLPDDLRWIEFGGDGFHYWGSDILQKHILTFNLQSNCHLRHLVTFIMQNSGIRQLKGFQNLAMLTSLNLSGCEYLEKIPNLSGSPNLRFLFLKECKSLVEVDDSVGFLDKLFTLDLGGCSRLKRFVTKLRLRSLQHLNLYGCTRLKSFPEIEAEMESLKQLDIEKSGIRELPSSIAYLTGLRQLWASNFENLIGTSLHHIYGLQHLYHIAMNRCPKPDSLYPYGRDLPERVLYYDYGSKLASVSLRENNFVSLPDYISKFVRLSELCLNGCKRLREFPHGLPPNLWYLYLDDCTSLEKIPKLPSGLRRLRLANCFGLSGDEIAKLENNLLNLNQESLMRSQLEVIYPGDEIPKQFSYTSKHLTATWIEQKDFGLLGYTPKHPMAIGLESIQKERETLLGLALSFVIPPQPKWSNYYDGRVCSDINEVKDYKEFVLGWRAETAHVGLMLVDLEKQPGDICKVKVQIPNKGISRGIKSCGVRPLFRKDGELLPLSLGPTSSLGSSGIVDDEYDWKQQWPSLSSNPADDHSKRMQIDPNVPFDIEEEQEQPSTISDLLGLWGARIESCGVHPLLRKEDEWLPSSLGPTSSLGKTPRPLGSSDTVHEEYDRQRQWLFLSSNPADDNPKRRQIDLNGPFDIEEEEQEQPSTSDDSHFFLD